MIRQPLRGSATASRDIHTFSLARDTVVATLVMGKCLASEDLEDRSRKSTPSKTW